MTDITFYVIYDVVLKQYLTEQGTRSAYDCAARMTATEAHNLVTDYYYATCRVVGPCIEGETP